MIGSNKYRVDSDHLTVDRSPAADLNPNFRARHEKSALFQWEEDIPPGNCCSSRKQPERALRVTAEREASGAKGPAWPDQRAHRPE